MNIVVSGGGTGGHIYPALALIREIKKHQPDAQFLYIGTNNGLEREIVMRENLPFHPLYITGFQRKISIKNVQKNVQTVANFLRAVSKSKRLMKKFIPDVVIGTGGYVAGPVVYAASRLGIPTIIHEQNSVPGLTNKFLSRLVDKVAVSMEEARSFFPEEKVVYTGNPRASEVLNGDPEKGRASTGLSRDKKTVLIFGGSRGARPINEAALGMLKAADRKSYQILYVTGEVHYNKVMEEASAMGCPPNVKICPFIHNMPDVLAAVDLVVARAGATTISELTALGLPSVLIPSPYVTNNHQEKNARVLEARGAAVVILESELNAERLLAVVDEILSDDQKYLEMRQNAKRLGVPDAAQRLYEEVVSLIKA
jgi:UDP-N-acetylglucosamine--N-acetylmuramyl-(pentapeptide) pyrophosphoryl-undecaprenol N-acetylglucosamine transferase